METIIIACALAAITAGFAAIIIAVFYTVKNRSQRPSVKVAYELADTLETLATRTLLLNR